MQFRSFKTQLDVGGFQARKAIPNTELQSHGIFKTDDVYKKDKSLAQQSNRQAIFLNL